MKSFIISLMVILTAVVVGCAPVTRSNWEPTAWHVQGPGNDVPEIGTLQDAQFNYDIIVTDLRKVFKTYYAIQESPDVTKHPKTLIAVAVRCRNKSNGTLILDADPIQMIDASQTLAKKLIQEEVVFKLYGGRMREASQLAQLEELNQPVRTSSTFFGAILAGYIAAQRADARTFIINEMYQKEYTAYDIFHQGFEPSSLPSGVSSVWVQYYHYTPGPIQIILQGQNVSDGLTFALPPAKKPTPEQMATTEGKKTEDAPIIFIAFVAIMVGVVIIGTTLID